MSNIGKISWTNFINQLLDPFLLFLKVLDQGLIGQPPLLSMATVGNFFILTLMSLSKMSSLKPIVGLKMNRPIIHTILGITSLLRILFLFRLVILSSFWFGWEEHYRLLYVTKWILFIVIVCCNGEGQIEATNIVY